MSTCVSNDEKEKVSTSENNPKKADEIKLSPQKQLALDMELNHVLQKYVLERQCRRVADCLTQGANPNHPLTGLMYLNRDSSAAQCILHLAMVNNDATTVKLLLEHGANPCLFSTSCWSFLAPHRSAIPILRDILKHYPQLIDHELINLLIENDWSDLFDEYLPQVSVDMLLNSDRRIVKNVHWFPMGAAAVSHNIHYLKALIDKKVPLNHPVYGVSPLECITCSGRLDNVWLMLEYGAKLSPQSSCAIRFLQEAEMKKDTLMIVRLTKLGVISDSNFWHWLNKHENWFYVTRIAVGSVYGAGLVVCAWKYLLPQRK
jgi:ankyrin repeat protein